MNADTLRFMSPSTLVTVDSPLYRPPCFPPPRDWAVSVDSEGAPLSLYGDDFWDFRAFERSATFNFKKDGISDENVFLVKQVVLLVLYHPRLFPGRIRSCVYSFGALTKIASVCDSKGVLISDVERFPAIHQEIADALQCASFKVYVNFLHRLRLQSDVLGFEVFGGRGLALLASQIKGHEKVQTPYIPPRIWAYQVKRLNECLDDFFEHEQALGSAFSWLSEAYTYNASCVKDVKYHSPFYEPHVDKKRVLFAGGFEGFSVEYGLSGLFEKWLGVPPLIYRSTRFTAYLNMVKEAALFYIMSFSLQRLNEVNSLRSDCFLIERDERLGDIAMLVGETTKTDPDDDARWVVPSTVKKAVDAASTIAKWRLKYFPGGESAPEWDSSSVPLALAGTEPWLPVKGNNRNSKNELIGQLRLGPFIDRYPLFFDPEEMAVTEEDWKIAVSMTPNIGNREGFGIGLQWPLAAHQLRRTTNVNMFASNMVSDQSLQWLMKHVSQKMTLYYGRNFTNLRLNSDAETSVIVESYKAIYRQIASVVEDSFENVRPHSKQMIPIKVVNLVEAGEEKQLTKLIAKGDIGCRRTLAGFCMKAGVCEYGGIESMAQCAGADGGGICTDAIFKRENGPALRRLKAAHEKKIESLTSESPRFNALKKEIYAIEVYLSVVNG